jgi:hypothetical protein
MICHQSKLNIFFQTSVPPKKEKKKPNNKKPESSCIAGRTVNGIDTLQNILSKS